MKRQAHLLEVVGALDASRGLAGGLNGRKQERDQDSDDGDHDEQFNQRERAAAAASHGFTPLERFGSEERVMEPMKVAMRSDLANKSIRMTWITFSDGFPYCRKARDRHRTRTACRGHDRLQHAIRRRQL